MAWKTLEYRHQIPSLSSHIYEHLRGSILCSLLLFTIVALYEYEYLYYRFYNNRADVSVDVQWLMVIVFLL